MQFRDLKAQYTVMKEEMDAAIGQVLEGCNFISGKQVAELESKLAEFVGVKHCITCANGTDALSLALMAWNIGKGDAVFVPDFTFFASGEVVAFEGATPIFVDVEKETFNISPEKLEMSIKKVLEEGKLIPKVIIAVDLFGQPANYPKIREIAKKYHLLILEDGAQGFGGAIEGKRACSFGDISTTSFFPAKPLGCYGDGGAVFTDNDEWAAYIRSICVHGKGCSKYDNIRIGMNSRLDTVQAAVLAVKLKAFKEYELDKVNEVAKWYNDNLNSEVFALPQVLPGFYSSWAQYTIQLPGNVDRNIVQERLKEEGIPTMVYYCKPMHLQQAFDGMDHFKQEFTVSEHLSETVLSLPMHPYMKVEDVGLVAGKLKNIVSDVVIGKK